MKRFLVLPILLLTISLTAQRTKYNFNSDWKVFVGDDSAAINNNFDDAGWKNVTLPYAWNEDDAFKKDIVDLRTGIAWYRKHFKLPASAKNQKVFLEFEGIRQAGEFYVNGNYVGIHENGVMAFGFDVTAFINFDDKENVISVRTDNNWDYREKATNTKFQWEDRNFNANYGGITKNTYLHVVPKIYQTLPLYSNLQTTGVYVYADGYNIKAKFATIHAESEIKNESTGKQEVQYSVLVSDAEGKVVKNFSGDKIYINPGETKMVKASSVVSGLNFWSWGYGYLYNVQTSLLVNNVTIDFVTTKTGFRKTAFKNGMVYLNDRVIQIHGYAQRTSNEWPAIGISVPAWLSDYSNKLMVDGNANLVRWMHITPWKQDVESCDRVGLMQAMPAGDAERDVDGVRWKQRIAVMKDAIIYNRNNPSIVFYECGNENISEAHMAEMKAVRNMYDPYGGRAIGSREMLASKEAEYGGEMLYINKSATKPVWATEYSRDEGLRKYWDNYTPPYHKDGEGPLYKGQDASSYNRNQDSHAKENVVRWYEYYLARPGTGKRVSSGGVNILFSESNTHHRGAENYRRSGEVDALRIKKENFYANEIMWNGWVDIEKHGTHIIGHWNYADSVVKDIDVISSADRVELLVNNKSLGFGKQSNRFLFTFSKVKFQAGVIKAIGYNAAGKKITETKIETAGQPHAVKLTPIVNPTGWKADGHDLALIEAEVVDIKGNRCPTTLNMINYKLQGNAEWRGGMAQGSENYIMAQSFPVECGVNRFLLRSTKLAGTVSVTAEADGLKSTTLNLTTNKIITENGVSTYLPINYLPVNLQRGPTPLTPPFTVSRAAVAVKNVTAGANADSAYKSYDDNEMSDWVNDGKLNTAWIEYELEHPALISEVVLKLNNFRSRIYPLHITIDGKEVFNANTEKTLGYYTAVCKPVKGTKVKIQLLGAAKNTGGEIMAEVNSKKLDDGVVRDDTNAKGTLSIIEVEFYERRQ